MLNRWALHLAVIAAFSTSALAEQPVFSVFDVHVRNGRELQRLIDSDVIPMACTPSLGVERVAVEVGKEWQVGRLRMPNQFITYYQPTVPTYTDGSDYRTEYLPIDAVIAHYDALVATHPNIVSKKQIGTTIQNRPIFAYRIFRQDLADVAVPPKSIVIAGNTHAREWISPSVTMHVAKMTADTLASLDNTFTAKLTDKIAIYVIPILNPDGYAYTWTNNRLWRKNRRPNGNNVFGVDLNRNYSTAFGGTGSSGTPSSETYRGPSAFSEPETSSLKTFANGLSPIQLWIDYHSYGQKILYPWTYTTNPCPHGPLMQSLGDTYKNAVLGVGGLPYTVGQGSTTLYIAAGTSKDWFYEQYTCPSYTVELRNLNTFELPPTEITPTQNENWAGFQAIINALAP